jgi:hypothetical protein
MPLVERSNKHMGKYFLVTARSALACAALMLSAAAFLMPSPADAAPTAAADMLLAQNQMRFAIGAPTIAADPRVVQAAQNHADYNAANGISGHFETAGLPYYTGYSARDRVAAAGLVTSFVSEVATGGSNALAGVQQLWDAPYHRLGLMHPNAFTSGWGHSDLGGRGATVADIAYDFSLRPVEFVRSPANGQTSVPTSWSGNESPNPLPAGTSGPVGYPIMVVYAAAPRVDMRAAEIVAPDGSRLPLFYAPQQFEYDYQVIIPQKPLTTNTTYHVRFDITVGGRFVTNEWDFSTGPTISAGGGGGGAPPAVVPQDSGLHSAWVDQTAVPLLQPAATSTVTMRFRNSGTKTWQKGVAGSQVALGVTSDATSYATALGMSVNWPSANRVALQNEASVAPGATASFTFTLRAPLARGTVLLPLRPVIDGVAWLEDQGVYVAVMTSFDYHSRWVSQSPYPTLRAGETSGPLTIQFRNAGSSVWTKGILGQEARLGVNGDDEMWAGLSVAWPYTTRPAVQAEMAVAPGANATFTFQVRAPSTPGVYSIHLRPVVDGAAWMEDEGVFLIVTVIP